MSRKVSILISAQDQYSDIVRKMADATRKFDKDAEGLQKKLTALDKTKVSLKLETDAAKKELKEAQTAFEKMEKAAADDTKLRAAMEKYDNLSRSLKKVTKEARDTEKALDQFGVSSSKLENRAGGLLGSLGEAGLTKMLGDSLSSAAVAGITSAMGSNIGDAVGSVISGAASGAALGSIIPGIGTAVGAGVGALAGGINAASQSFTKKDDALKGVVQEQYGTQQERMRADIDTGSGIAAQREMNMISFTTLLKDEDVARDYLDWVIDTAARTPYNYEDLEAVSKTLSAYKYDPEQMKDMLIKIGDAGGALSLDMESMDEVAQKLGFMKISDRATLKELNVMMQRGIRALDYLAEGYGVTTDEISRMITASEVSGAKASQMILDAMGEEFNGAMEKQSLTYSGLQSTVVDLTMNQQNAYGEGYNAERKKGLAEQIDYLGDTAAREDTGRLIGEYHASLDNLHEQMIRDAETEAYERIRRDHLTGAEAGRVLQEARVQAEADYMSSEGMQAEIAMQKKLVGDIRDVMIEDGVYRNFGYDMGQEMSVGMAESMWKGIYENSAWVTGTAGRQTDNRLARTPGGNTSSAETTGSKNLTRSTGTAGRQVDNRFASNSRENTSAPGKAFGMAYVPYNDYPARLHEGERVLTARENREYNSTTPAPGKAFGMAYVPYNDYPARLHEGERVLTAQENRTYNSQSMGNIIINMNGAVLREESDVEAVARALAMQIVRARDLM